MTEITHRDEVWDSVLFHIAYNDAESFTRADLEIPPQISDNTAIRVLNAMDDMGWLDKEGKYDNTYYPGDRLYFLASVLKRSDE